MSPQPRKPKLADLSDEDRKALRDELVSEDEVRQTVAEELAARRDQRLRVLLEDRDHLRGCPADGRVEAYAETKPAQPKKALPALPVTVVRCMECGGTTVIERPYSEVLDELNREPEDAEEPVTA